VNYSDSDKYEDETLLFNNNYSTPEYPACMGNGMFQSHESSGCMRKIDIVSILF
jgi:hypothetical protein